MTVIRLIPKYVTRKLKGKYFSCNFGDFSISMNYRRILQTGHFGLSEIATKVFWFFGCGKSIFV